MVLPGLSCNQVTLNGKIDELKKKAYEQNTEGMRRTLKEIVPEYVLRNGNGELSGVAMTNGKYKFGAGLLVRRHLALY